MMCRRNVFVLMLLGVLAFAMNASAALITYVDADIPLGGNSSPASTASSGTDDLWRFREYANNGTIYESGGIYGNDNTENCLRLLTTATVPGNALGYDVFAYFWTDGSSWRIRASLTNDLGELPLYIAGTDPTTQAIAEDFDSVVMVAEGNRTMWQVNLGAALVGSDPLQNYTLSVYIDDDAAHLAHDMRTWYDGIGYSVIPEPATIALLGLGGLALLRRKRS